MWVLVDQIRPGKPILINTDCCTDIAWEDGMIAFETADTQCIEFEADKQTFIQIAQALGQKGKLLLEVE